MWLRGFPKNGLSHATCRIASRSSGIILFHAVLGANGLGLAHLRYFLGTRPNISQACFWVNPCVIASLMASTTAVLTSFLKWPLSKPERPNPFFFLTRRARARLLPERLLFRRAVLRLFDTVPQELHAACGPACRLLPMLLWQRL